MRIRRTLTVWYQEMLSSPALSPLSRSPGRPDHCRYTLTNALYYNPLADAPLRDLHGVGRADGAPALPEQNGLALCVGLALEMRCTLCSSVQLFRC